MSIFTLFLNAGVSFEGALRTFEDLVSYLSIATELMNNRSINLVHTLLPLWRTLNMLHKLFFVIIIIQIKPSVHGVHLKVAQF